MTLEKGMKLKKVIQIKIGLISLYKIYINVLIIYLVISLSIYILCNSGERATIGYSYLKSKGYNPIVIVGGMEMLEALNEN